MKDLSALRMLWVNAAFIRHYVLRIVVNGKVYADDPIKIFQPQIVPVSPEAAAVQKYVCYPVNYSTGLVDISIPLYTVKTGDLKLPITLSYHTGGVKLRQWSGWVGTNWALNADPSIMREIRGIPDDEPYGGCLKKEYFRGRLLDDSNKRLVSSKKSKAR